MPQAMRIPVNEPEHWPKLKASMFAARRWERSSSRRIIGASISEWRFSAIASSTKSSSPRNKATEHSSVEVSTARRFKKMARAMGGPLYPRRRERLLYFYIKYLAYLLQVVYKIIRK